MTPTAIARALERGHVTPDGRRHVWLAELLLVVALTACTARDGFFPRESSAGSASDFDGGDGSSSTGDGAGGPVSLTAVLLPPSRIESEGNVVLRLTASAAAATDILLNASLSGSAAPVDDYVAPTGSTIVFAAGNLTQDVTLTLVDDDVREDAETIVVSLLVSTGESLSPAVLTAIINDDDHLDSPVAGRLVDAGGDHVCARRSDGAVVCWGRRYEGRLGDGLANRGDEVGEMAATPAIDLGTGRTAKLIDAGEAHVCAQLDDDSVKCWGWNAWGQLGQPDAQQPGARVGSMGDNLPAVDLGGGATLRATGAKTLAAGGTNTCAILTGGALKCWGGNPYGALGLGDIDVRGDDAAEMGDNLPTVDLGSGRTAVRVAVSPEFACALLDNGRIKCWGFNSDGQLGLGDTESRGDAAGEMGDDLPVVDLGGAYVATDITTGRAHACAVLDDGSARCWGNGFWGGLGYGDTESRGDEPGEMGASLPAIALGTGRTAVAIAAGNETTCAILDNQSLKCWGFDLYGMLGQEMLESRGDEAGEMGDALQPVDVGGLGVLEVTLGSEQVCARRADDSVVCWGDSRAGQLGIPPAGIIGDDAGEMGTALQAINFGWAATAQVSVGTAFGCGRSSTGLVECFGHNEFGVLGQEDANLGDDPGEVTASMAAVDLPPDDIAQIEAGPNGTCVRGVSGAARCWGRNDGGQLGTGDTFERGELASDMGANLQPIALGTGRRVRDIGAGDLHKCALLDDWTVKCWGLNYHGAIGNGDTSLGQVPGEMGDNLPAVALPGGERVVALAVGYYHNCAIGESNQLYCWGGNFYGELGRGDYQPIGDDPDEMGDFLQPVALGLGRRVLDVRAGTGFTCALLDDQQLKCWGNGDYGKLGVGNANDFGNSPTQMGDNLVAASLGPGQRVRRVRVGSTHVCALLESGLFKCWGDGLHGQTGAEDSVFWGDQPNELGDAMPAVDLGFGTGVGAETLVDFSLGDGVTCVRGDQGTIKCFGYNADGQLGLNDFEPYGNGSGEMGTGLPEVVFE